MFLKTEQLEKSHQQNQHNKDKLNKQESAHPLNLQSGFQNDLFLQMSSYTKDALYEITFSNANVTICSCTNL